MADSEVRVKRAGDRISRSSEVHESSKLPKISARSFRIAFYYIYIACTIGLNAAIFIPSASIVQAGTNRAFNMSWIVLHALSVVVFLSLLKTQNSRNLLIVIAVGAYILASATWSASPITTLVYGGMMVGNILVAHLMASELSLEEIVQLLARLICVLCLVGVVAYYIGYEQMTYYDVHQRPNILGGQPFRGFTSHKILMGLYATIGSVAILATTRGAVRLAWMLLLAYCVALTGSMTGLVVFLATIPIYAITTTLLRHRARSFDVFLTGGTTAIVIAILVASRSQQLLSMLGRDSTLTGRTTLWRIGINAWTERPVLGWGFNAYLHSPYSAWAKRMFNPFGNWDIPHFHESYIQTAADFGIVGVAALVGVLAYILMASYRYAIAVNTSVGTFAFVTTIVMIFSAFGMFIFFNYNHFGTFLIALLFFSLKQSSEMNRAKPDAVGGPAKLPRGANQKATGRRTREVTRAAPVSASQRVPARSQGQQAMTHKAEISGKGVWL